MIIVVLMIIQVYTGDITKCKNADLNGCVENTLCRDLHIKIQDRIIR